jgi:lipid-A-disaccharide synthase
MKYYLIAGEASGDLHGSNLIREINKLDPQAHLRCWGGDLMQAAGAEVVKHYRDLAFMGFVEVVSNLPTILRNMRFCKQDILSFAPDVVIFIDYPGFNIPMAEFCKKQGLRTVYYISPQVWAWKEGRVKTLRKVVDKMLVILPFEKEFYQKWNYEVEYVGHPLVQVIDEFKASQQSAVSKQQAGDSQQAANTVDNRHLTTVAILPGSRKQEVLKKLPVMLETTRQFPDIRFVIAKAPSLDDDFYQPLIQSYPNVKTVKGKTYDLLIQADAAMVTSGTATLETALFGVPEVICYKGNPISYQIGKRLIKVKYICLVNLIMDRPVVTELIQGECNPGNLGRELRLLLEDQHRIAQMKADYAELRDLLSRGGRASEKAAARIVGWLKQANPSG